MFKNSKSLKSRFLQVIVVVFVITIVLSLSLIYYTLNQKVNTLSTKFARQYALKEKSRITAPIKREIALVQKMVETPILRKWAQNEDNKQLKKNALRELESYRDNFQAQNYFFIIDKSLNYYFNNKKNEYKNNQLRYTLDKNNEKDQWYFASMKKVDDYLFNMNYDRELQKTKLWIDAIMYNSENEKIGMAGTGISMDSFIQDFLKSNSSFITPLLFDKKGYIRAYQDTNLIQMSTIDKEEKASESSKKSVYKLLQQKDRDRLRSMVDRLTNNSEEVATIKFKMNNDERIAAVTYVSSMNWYMMSIVDTSEIFSMWDFVPTIAVLVISLIVVLVVITLFINNSILNPIKSLTSFTEEIAEGNYGKKIDMDYENEFGTLADSFNEMTETIKKHTNHLEEMVDQRTKELRQSNQELSAKNKKIMDNINYAQHIQEAILPARGKIDEWLKEYFIIWQPRDLVGGDFYWIREIEDKILIAVIDCTGHGVPGALMTMTADAILNRIVDIDRIKDPAKVLKELNIGIKETLHKNNNDPKKDDGLDMGLCSVDKNKKQILFAGAKISLYYNDEDGIVRIKGDRESIGYQRSKKEYEYTNHEIDTKENRNFYMTSDGYLDQNGEEENKRFGRKRFIKTLEEIYDMNLDQQKNQLIKELKKHAGSEEQRDDITVLGFRI